MDYKASKAPFWKVKLLTVAAIVLIANTTSLLAVTITDTRSVSVTALVVDPNATTTGGNATSSTSTPPFSGGGGSYGGSFATATRSNSIVISGVYAPGMTLSVLSSGNILASTTVERSGSFSLLLPNLKSGVYSLLLVMTDPLYKDKQYQASLSYTVYVSDFAETFISDVVFPPLFSPVKTSFKQNSTLEFYGKALPKSTVAVFLDSKKIGSTSVTTEGVFSLAVKQVINPGKHAVVYSYVTPLDSVPTSKAQMILVYVDTSKERIDNLVCGSRVDFSLDCKINIVDFSILAYWYKRTHFPTKYDLNDDGKIDIKDFSVMAYHWTG